MQTSLIHQSFTVPSVTAYNMDMQTIINVLLASVSGLVGWFGMEIWSTVKSQRVEIASIRHELYELREEMASTRVHREDFKEALREVKEMLNRIIEKLERKADK